MPAIDGVRASALRVWMRRQDQATAQRVTAPGHDRPALGKPVRWLWAKAQRQAYRPQEGGPLAEELAVDEPVVDEPVVEELVVEELVVDTPAAVEELVVDTSAAVEVAVDKQAAGKLVPQAVEAPEAGKPVQAELRVPDKALESKYGRTGRGR